MKNRGFTLVETLVVIAILGLLAAIAIPLMLNSINRSKQSTTIANIRAIASAWEARATEVKAYNAAGIRFRVPASTLTATQLSSMLAPTYIKQVPRLDGWGNALEFRTDYPVGSRKAATVYSIRSPGRDGKMQTRGRTKYTVGTTTKFDCDIVYSNGTFVVYPAGQQR